MTNVRWVRLGSVGQRTQGVLCVFNVGIEASKNEDKSWDREEDMKQKLQSSANERESREEG